MKSLLLLLPILVISCSSKQDSYQITSRAKVSQADMDAFSNESYQRWSKERLSQSKELVTSCHQGKVKETLEKYKSEFSSNHENPLYWIHIANCYYLGNRLTKADFYYRLALEKSKHPGVKALSYNNLAVIAFDWGQWEKGKDFLDLAVRNAPASKSTKYNLAQYYSEIGYHEKVISLLTDPVFKSHKDAEINFKLAQAFLDQGDFSRAQELFEKIPSDKRKREDIASFQALLFIKNQQRSISSTPRLQEQKK